MFPKYVTTVVSFTKDVNPRLAKRPLVFNGRLANRGLTSLVKEATAGRHAFIFDTFEINLRPWKLQWHSLNAIKYYVLVVVPITIWAETGDTLDNVHISKTVKWVILFRYIL